MQNIISYTETEMRPFTVLPLSDVDSLVLCQLSYIFFDSIVASGNGAPQKMQSLLQAEHFDEMLSETLDCELNKKLIFALCASPRFRDIKFHHYVNQFDVDNEMQFSAITFLLPQGGAFIAYRGTDETLIGWKEDFNMAYKTPVPSQTLAAEYLKNVGSKIRGTLYIGGHSKGGNLAVYAAMRAPAQLIRRICLIFDHDGPGFRTGVLDSDAYHLIKDKIHKTVPHSSMIGMLLETHDNYSVVESSSIGVWQHDPYSWKIDKGGFVLTRHVSGSAMYINRSVHDWLDGISDDKREQFIDILFGVLDVGDFRTFPELLAGWQKNFTAIFSAMHNTDPEIKKFVRQLIKDFGVQLMKNLRLRNKFLPTKD